jgi:hypothetical protein
MEGILEGRSKKGKRTAFSKKPNSLTLSDGWAVVKDGCLLPTMRDYPYQLKRALSCQKSLTTPFHYEIIE